MTRDLAAMRAACEAGYVSTADYVKTKENLMTDNPASEIAEIRTPADFAIEFAEYLADRAEDYMVAIQCRARDGRNDAHTGLVSAVYEFRKRAKVAKADRATLLAEVERLRTENERLTAHYTGMRSAGARRAAEIASLTAQLAKCREALKPFKVAAEKLRRANLWDDANADAWSAHDQKLLVGHLRAAKAAYEAIQ